jgi:HAD superfamily hydrolase (TIGR01509 family)
MGKLKAIFFDMDGTIVDTEKDGHRVAFNQAFAQFGIPVEWDIQQYQQLLNIAGGKERMKYYFLNQGGKYIPKDANLDGLVQQLHQLKTELFISLITEGKLPLRTGIKRIMEQANEESIAIAICTTSNEKAAKSIIHSLLPNIKINLLLAGDIVQCKKPDPEIYCLALEKLGLYKNEVVVVEDSENGVVAAKNAGLKVLVTVNEYTRNENLTLADVILTNLGDRSEKAKVLAGDFNLEEAGVVNMVDLIELFNPK